MDFHQKPITFIGQVNLKVKDLERSLTFYKEIIGFKLLKQTGKTAELTADGNTVLLTIEQPDHAISKQEGTTGLFHFALLLPNRSDLGNVLKHFIQIKYPIQGASDHLVSEALYLADPDGNGIEIYADRHPSEWEWINNEVVMPSDPLDHENLLAQATDSSWKELPSSTIMGHIHLHVSDLQKNRQFYIDGLGFEVVSRYGNHALFISDGKYHHHIAMNVWNGVNAPQAPSNSAGLESFTVKLSNKKQRDQIIQQLKAIGAPISEENEHLVTSDPSGNRIRLSI